jgi:hypothetical protein
MTVVVDVRSEPGRDQGSAHARGVLFVHSCPSAVAPHVEWALARVFGISVDIDWAPQPVLPGQLRAEVIWHGPCGSAAKVASALVAFSTVRFEVTEDPNGSTEGERYAVTRLRGGFAAPLGAHGDVLVHEDRLRSLLIGARIAGSSGDVRAITEEIDRLIGTPWDNELEPFRIAHEDSTVRVLHEVV